MIKRYAAMAVGIVAAVIYGVLTRLVFNSPGENLTLAFFVFTPPILGFLTVMLATDQQKESWSYTISGPWLTVGICVLIAGVFVWEAWFCILLALPIFLILASIGGIVARGVWRLSQEWRGSAMGAVVVLAALPFLIAPIERLFPVRETVRRVHSQIEIEAPPEIVWQNITTLEKIHPFERRAAFFHLVGLPRPIEARLTCERVGCIRRGVWENGLAFDGTITHIEPGKSYWVRLEVDTSHVRPSMAPLSQIGGPFDMVDDGYEIEALDTDRSVLHLYSTYRVKTGINAYASLWIDFLLRDIQAHILHVEKGRSER